MKFASNELKGLCFLPLILACLTSCFAKRGGTNPEDAGLTDGDATTIDSEVIPTDSNQDAPIHDPVRPAITKGVWVVTAHHLDFPKNPDDNASTKERELKNMMDDLSDVGTNAIFFQVRSEGDACYPSSISPWSRFMAGEQGRAPGFDPVGVAIAEAHRKGMQFHAWINPYRVKLAQYAHERYASSHVTRTHPEWVVDYGEVKWLNPALPDVREYILSVIEELLMRYPLDGIHFDDYFYPYPDGGKVFDDRKAYTAYRESGGTDALEAWRRSNVSALVKDVHDLIVRIKPEVMFGISPFGIHQPGTPEGVRGLDAYNVLGTDAPKWLREGWVDYLAPQLYWTTEHPEQNFDRLLEWWAQLPVHQGSRRYAQVIIPGINIANYGTSERWDFDQMKHQMNAITPSPSRPPAFPQINGGILLRAQHVLEVERMNDLVDETWDP